MNTDKSTKEVKWHDKNLLIKSSLVGIIFFAIFWGLAKHKEPAAGHSFEKLPPVTGTYQCCDAGGRQSISWVGSTQVNCAGFSYYQIGTGRNDCGLKNELNGAQVIAERVFIPTIRGRSPLVSTLSSNGKIYYSLTDSDILNKWRSGSRDQAIMLALFVAAVFNGIQLVISDARIQRAKGEEK